MKIQYTIILLPLFVGLPVFGQSPFYDAPCASAPINSASAPNNCVSVAMSSASVPMNSNNETAGFRFAAMPSAFTNEYSVPFAAGDLAGLDVAMSSGPRKAPPTIGGEEEPPATPNFQPVGDIPVLFMLLLAGVYAVSVRTRRRTQR